MEMHLGCRDLSDAEFVTAFEQCRLAPANFHHADHVRLAWLYAGRYPAAVSEARLLRGIRRFAAKAGVPEKFQHTTTVAWARLVAASRAEAGAQQTFGEWIASHPEFLERRLLEKYYSKGRLDSETARSAWVEPDLQPLLSSLDSSLFHT
jgi:hypothetical protein